MQTQKSEYKTNELLLYIKYIYILCNEIQVSPTTESFTDIVNQIGELKTKPLVEWGLHKGLDKKVG